ncbi:MAG TPA: type IIA DNA topoisomerase subunit B, partial [Bacteroidetes bacterium]|nr:type IIA DNA topoisomerase subunit B [Bacteroidota bacterium]
IVKTIREFFGKNFDATDIRASIVGALAIRVQEPVFESQTKTKLGSTHTEPRQKGRMIRSWIHEVVKRRLDNYLHKNQATADALLKRIKQSERERKDIAGIKKLANDRARKANLHNRKLRDCKVHFNTKHKDASETLIFITEGDSASGSITKARSPKTQAVFSLKGKPLNSYGLTKKIVYENEEFNLLQHALNIEDGIEMLRYNKIIIATDADVDGMHIRLLLLTFFLQFFPDLVRQGHVYILQTPLFRVRNKKETIYCYSEVEKQAAMSKLGRNPEITRFKGLGEISPDEFGNFIGENIRLEPVIIKKDNKVGDLLKYFMGKNSSERQEFIIENLRVEKDLSEEVA